MTDRLDHLFALNGRRALVTGGHCGLGSAIADALGRQGAGVVLVARRAAALEQQASRLAALGIDASFIAGDLATQDGPDRIVDALPGSVDILVNAAGINLRQPFEAVTLDAFDQHMAIHLRAPFRLIQRLAPAMAARQFGRILMLASLQSARAFPNSAPYGAAKGGVAQLTRAVAERWSRHGITCNAIAPGFFPTAMTEAVFRDEAASRKNAAQTAIGLGAALILDRFGAYDIRLGEPNPQRRATAAAAGPFGAYAPGSAGGPPPGSVDFIIDAVGAAATRSAASRLAKPGGTIVHIGLLPGHDGFDIRRITLQGIIVRGCYCYTVADFRDVVGTLAQHGFGTLEWVQRMPLDRGTQAFETLDRGDLAAAKIILEP